MPLLTDEEILHMEYSKEDCFIAMAKAIQSFDEFEIKDADSTVGVIQINSTLSEYTLGEFITINLLEDENGTRIKISSTAKVPSLFAKKKNIKNTQSIIMAFSEFIKAYPKVQEKSSESKPDDIKFKLQKLKDLYEQSLISEDEYKSKKGEILSAI